MQAHSGALWQFAAGVLQQCWFTAHTLRTGGPLMHTSPAHLFSLASVRCQPPLCPAPRACCEGAMGRPPHCLAQTVHCGNTLLSWKWGPWGPQAEMKSAAPLQQTVIGANNFQCAHHGTRSSVLNQSCDGFCLCASARWCVASCHQRMWCMRARDYQPCDTQMEPAKR
jgi:hypothetical protein